MLPRNSARVRAFVSKLPSSAVVRIRAFACFAPRIATQRCSASIRTPTPCGSISSSSSAAICRVIRSCTCRRRANASTTRGILESPTTR